MPDPTSPVVLDGTDLVLCSTIDAGARAVLDSMKALPPSRELSLAATAIEQGVLWFGLYIQRGTR